MKKLTCKKCEYEWGYKGVAAFWTSCPRCLFRVRTGASITKIKKKDGVNFYG